MTGRRSAPVVGPRSRGLAMAGALALASIATARVARAQEVACDEGDTEVRGLVFAGNRAFSDDQLAGVVVTTPSSSVYRHRLLRFPPLTWFGQRRCIQRNEVVLDRARLILFYRNHGYPDVTVDTAVARDGRAIKVRFAIVEGRPIRVDSVAVNWLESVPGAARIVRGLPVRAGRAFDKNAVDAARDTILVRLGNSGYPWAQVLRTYETQRERYSAQVGFDILPGPRTRIGKVEIVSQPRAGEKSSEIPTRVTRRLTGLRQGAVYRDRDVAAARRNLYLTEAFQSVAIERDSARANTGADTLVNLRVTVAEGFMRAARVSAGYGTIDCFRGQGDLTHRNVRVGGLATRMEVTGRVSKIGRGEPLGSMSTGKALCPRITSGQDFDPYSNRLNYYGGVTLRQPVLTGVPNILPTITLFSQRASEYKAFLREVPIGFVGTYDWVPRRTLPQVFSYAVEYGSTQAQPAVFCAVFNACQEDDRARQQERRRSAALGWSITRNRANDAVNPTAGTITRLDLRHASKLIGSDTAVQFNKAIGDVSWYLPGGGGNTLALRLRFGGVLGRDLSGVPNYIPQQERLFAGGAQTVRGFRQNELGPLVYVATLGRGLDTLNATDPETGDPILVDGQQAKYIRIEADSNSVVADSLIQRAVPTGGNTMAVANVEYRVRSPVLSDLVQLVAFFDVGNVWDRRVGGDRINLLGTPGFGVRVASPFGPIRVDFGYNPHKPVAGAVFYEASDAAGSPLYCVSPGNTIPLVEQQVGTTTRLVQANTNDRCPASGQVTRRRGFRAWNVSLAIAQAF